MIAKGFDFPGVALVGVINADPLLDYPILGLGNELFNLWFRWQGGRAAGYQGKGLDSNC